MKTILAVCGVLFLLLLMVGSVVIGYIAYNGSKLDVSSKAYVDESVPVIVATWSKDELIKRSSLQLRHEASDEQIDRLFAALSSKLGAFQSYDGSKGQANVSYTSQDGQLTTASYTALASYQNGKAEIQIKLIRNDDVWKILQFHIALK